MSHIQYTICRSGSYYYNRRVHKHAVQSYGKIIRCILSTDIHEAKALIQHIKATVSLWFLQQAFFGLQFGLRLLGGRVEGRPMGVS